MRWLMVRRAAILGGNCATGMPHLMLERQNYKIIIKKTKISIKKLRFAHYFLTNVTFRHKGGAE